MLVNIIMMTLEVGQCNGNSLLPKVIGTVTINISRFITHCVSGDLLQLSWQSGGIQCERSRDQIPSGTLHMLEIKYTLHMFPTHYCVQLLTVKQSNMSTLAFDKHLFSFPLSTEAIIIVIVWQLDLQLPMQSVLPPQYK